MILKIHVLTDYLHKASVGLIIYTNLRIRLKNKQVGGKINASQYARHIPTAISQRGNKI